MPSHDGLGFSSYNTKFLDWKVRALSANHTKKKKKKKIAKFRKNRSRNTETLLGIDEEGVYGGSFLPATPPSTSWDTSIRSTEELLMARLTGDAVTEAAQESLLIYITFRRNGTYLHFCRPNGIRRNGYKPCS